MESSFLVFLFYFVFVLLFICFEIDLYICGQHFFDSFLPFPLEVLSSICPCSCLLYLREPCPWGHIPEVWLSSESPTETVRRERVGHRPQEYLYERILPEALL